MSPRTRTKLERRPSHNSVAKGTSGSDAAEEPMLDVKTVAHSLRVGTQQVYRQLRAGKLEAAKIGGQWRVKRSALQKFIEDSIWVPNSRKNRNKENT